MDDHSDPPRTLPNLRRAALRYAEQGQAVFPCYPADIAQDDGRVSRAKAPLTRHGLDEATTDQGRIERWWTKWPEAAIGLVTGQLFDVIDVDCKPGGVNGYLALKHLGDAGLVWDSVVAVVSTPSGGRHLFFPADPAHPMRNATFGKRGIDLRGKGGYVIAPPSVLAGADGRVVGCYRLDRKRPVAEGAPLDHERVRTLLGDHPRRPTGSPQAGLPGPRAGQEPMTPRSRTRQGDMGALVHWLSQAARGDRNSSLYWAACRAVEQGEDPDVLVDTALELGLGAAEVEATIHSARRRPDPSQPPHARPDKED